MKTQALTNYLRVERARAGVSQAELAARIGTYEQKILRFEKGRLQPTSDEMELIADALGTSIEAIWPDDEAAA